MRGDCWVGSVGCDLSSPTSTALLISVYTRTKALSHISLSSNSTPRHLHFLPVRKEVSSCLQSLDRKVCAGDLAQEADLSIPGRVLMTGIGRPILEGVADPTELPGPVKGETPDKRQEKQGRIPEIHPKPVERLSRKLEKVQTAE